MAGEGRDMITELLIKRMEDMERNLLLHIGEVKDNLSAQIEATNVRIDSANERLDGVNERLDNKVNGKLDRHDAAIAEIVTHGCARFKEHETPPPPEPPESPRGFKRLGPHTKTMTISGGVSAALWALLELVHHFADKAPK